MKQQKLIVVLFIILCICSCTAITCSLPNFQYDLNRDCDEKNYGIHGNLWVSHQVNYTYSISPNPIREFDPEGYSFYLATNVNYTLEWKSSVDSSCSGKNYFFTPEVHYVISLPKCRYSVGSATFVKPEDFDYIQASCESAPCDITLLNQNNLQLSYEDSQISCYFSPPVYELTDEYPSLKVQDTLIYKSSGSVQLLNTSKYSTWTLEFQENNEIVPESSPSSATWINLESNDYILTLESIGCGVQRIPVNISFTWPTFFIEFNTNETCPRNSSVSISFDDASIFDYNIQVTVDNQPITQIGQSIYLLAPGEPSFVVKISFSAYSYSKIVYSPVIIGDVHYTVDICNCSATLYYNETQYPDLIAYYQAYQFPLTDNTFKIPNCEIAFVESPCFFNSFPIISSSASVQPSYTIVRPQEYCGDTMDVLVSNYYEFYQIQMGYMDVIQHDGQGLFKNVKPGENSIQYQANECVDSNRIELPRFYYSEEEIEEIIEIVSYPSCNIPGNVSYTVRDVKNNIPSDTSYFPYTQTGSYELFTSISNDCDQIFYKTWYPPIMEKYVNNFPGTITVLKNASCKYSNDAEIVIFSNTIPIEYIVANGRAYNPSKIDGFNVHFTNLYYGETEIILQSSNCPNYYETISIGTENYWEFPAVITPVTGDCSVPNGKISFDSSIFESINDPQDYVGLSSGLHKIDFELSNGTCFGSVKIFVPTVSDSYATSTILKQPSCVDNNDGYVELFINDKNGNKFAPTQFEYNYMTGTNNGISLVGGDHNFIVYNNSCSWSLKVSMEANEPEFVVKKIGETLHECKQKTFVSVTPSIDVIVNDIYSDSPFKDYQNNIFSYFPQTFGKRKQLYIKYNGVCLKTLKIEETKDLYQDLAWPTFSVPFVDCSDPSVQNTVAQINNPTNMMLFLSVEDTFSCDKVYLPQYTSNMDINVVAKDMKSQCVKEFSIQNINKGIVAKTFTKSTCPGALDGKIQVNVDPKSNIYQVFNNDFEPLPVESGSSLMTYNNISGVEYNLLRSFRNNPFCSVVENVKIVVDEPTVSISSVGVCDASDRPIGDVGVVTNTLSITTTNVTYNLNGVASSNPIFKGLSVGDYSSTVTIYNSVCRRVIKNSVSVAQLPSVSVTVD
ncbi:hypothetical protein CYY_010297, partial [Polysphondylium violaceum]